jgi:hypothetical protein
MKPKESIMKLAEAGIQGLETVTGGVVKLLNTITSNRTASFSKSSQPHPSTLLA